MSNSRNENMIPKELARRLTRMELLKKYGFSSLKIELFENGTVLVYPSDKTYFCFRNLSSALEFISDNYLFT